MASVSTISLYEKLVAYLVKEPTVRVITAIKQMILKAHLYEAVSIIQEISASLPCSEKLKTLTLNASSGDDQQKANMENEELEKKDPEKVVDDLDLAGGNTPNSTDNRIVSSDILSEAELNTMRTSLAAIHTALKNEFIFKFLNVLDDFKCKILPLDLILVFT